MDSPVNVAADACNLQTSSDYCCKNPSSRKNISLFPFRSRKGRKRSAFVRKNVCLLSRNNVEDFPSIEEVEFLTECGLGK